MAPASGLTAKPSYTTAVLEWRPGTADSQVVYVDTDKTKVDANCIHGCAVKQDLSSSSRTTTLTGLQPGKTYYYRIVSKKSCGTKWAEGSFTTKPAVEVKSAQFVNNQKQGIENPPAVVRCEVNHDDDGAVKSGAGKRLGIKSSGSMKWVEFYPELSAGEHSFECHVDTSVAPAEQGKESATVSYSISAPRISLSVENGTIGSGTSVSAGVEADFFLNWTRVYVDDVLLREEDLRSGRKTTASLGWDLKLPVGSHRIRVVVSDYVGNTGEAAAMVNVADGAVSCAIQPYEITGDTDFTITCYDTQGRETACPDMSVKLEDATAGTVQGNRLDLDED